MKMEPPTFNLHEKLRARERVSARPGANVHRARQVYESVFPNHTVDAVSGFEDVHVHKFTDCGRYLICFSRNQHDLVVFRFKGFGCASPVEGSGAGTAAASPGTPPSAKGDFTPNDADAIPEPGTSRDKYFDLAYTTPLTVDADLLARDFAVTVLDGDYLLLASSTPAEAPPRDTPDGGGGRGAAEQGNRNPGNANRESVANPDARRGGSDETPRGDRVGTSNTALITSEEAASSTARASGAAAVRRARDEARADTAARRGAGSPNAVRAFPFPLTAARLPSLPRCVAYVTFTRTMSTAATVSEVLVNVTPTHSVGPLSNPGYTRRYKTDPFFFAAPDNHASRFAHNGHRRDSLGAAS
jgi:hypothetical protein